MRGTEQITETTSLRMRDVDNKAQRSTGIGRYNQARSHFTLPQICGTVNFVNVPPTCAEVARHRDMPASIHFPRTAYIHVRTHWQSRVCAYGSTWSIPSVVDSTLYPLCTYTSREKYCNIYSTLLDTHIHMYLHFGMDYFPIFLEIFHVV